MFRSTVGPDFRQSSNSRIMNQPHRTCTPRPILHTHLTHLNLPRHSTHSTARTAVRPLPMRARGALFKDSMQKGGAGSRRDNGWSAAAQMRPSLGPYTRWAGATLARQVCRAAASGAAGAFQSASGAVCSLGVQPRHAARARHGHETRNLWARLLAASASLIALSFASRSRTHRSTSARITS